LELEPLQARFIAGAADNIICFLYKLHKRYPCDHPDARKYYKAQEYNDFNLDFDDGYGWDTLRDYNLRPSEILFNMDLTAYLELYEEYMNSQLSLNEEK